jgi:hypothetical protein
MFGLMNAETKITLSAKEQELVCNTHWILTKHTIIHKVFDLFGKQSALMQQWIIDNEKQLPAEVNKYQPKITKGENYQSLPYVILDYPRCFEKENTLAIRTMFWWGNFFSVTLQLAGNYKEAALPSLLNNFLKFCQDDHWVCISDDPWQHHFKKDNYVLIKECTAEEFAYILNRYQFIKIAKRIPLTQWNEVPGFIERSFTEMMSLVKN